MKTTIKKVMYNSKLMTILIDSGIDFSKETLREESIPLMEATQMDREKLIWFVFGNDIQYMEDLPIEMQILSGGKYHAPSHVFDTRTKKPINIIEYGQKLCLID